MGKYSKPAKLKGWDFSQVRVVEVGPRIDYSKVVESRLEKTKILLDMGTGGGKKFLVFASKVKEAIATDIDQRMIKTAAENLDKTNLNNVHLVLCDSEKLPIAGVSVDVMINRHSPFDAQEAFRVLKPSGIFVTQQVSEGDKRNFKAVFGRGQSFEVKSGTLKKRYLKELREAGIQVIEEKTVNTIEYYRSMNDVIFLLANTPIIPNFDFEKEQNKLEEIEERFRTDRGIRTTSERFLMVGIKKRP